MEEFRALYNQHWLIERLGFEPSVHARRRLALQPGRLSMVRFICPRNRGRYNINCLLGYVLKPNPERGKEMDQSWLNTLKAFVRQRPVVIFQFEEREWCRLQESRRGVNEFTCAKYHELVTTIQTPNTCLLFGRDESESEAYFGIVKSRAAVTTLESRIKVSCSRPISPSSKADLFRLATERRHVRQLRHQFDSNNSVNVLSPQLSVYLVEILASIETNHDSMRTVTASLTVPTHYNGMTDVQENALQTALGVFGLSSKDRGPSL